MQPGPYADGDGPTRRSRLCATRRPRELRGRLPLPADLRGIARGSQPAVVDPASDEPVPAQPRRPGESPYVEDSLAAFRIGEIDFGVVKPCDRCVVTTTDQESTERGVEPLRTLATYRRVGGEVMFGQNVIHLGTGRLSVETPLLR